MRRRRIETREVEAVGGIEAVDLHVGWSNTGVQQQRSAPARRERQGARRAELVAELQRPGAVDRDAAFETIGGSQIQCAGAIERERALAGGVDPAAARAILVGDDIGNDGFLARRRREDEVLVALKKNPRAE